MVEPMKAERLSELYDDALFAEDKATGGRTPGFARRSALRAMNALVAELRTPAHPTGEVGDIVERLRAYRTFDEWSEHGCRHGICDEAADLIQSLQSRLSIGEGNVERVAMGLYEHHWKGATVSGSWEQEQDCIKDKYRAGARAAIASLGGVG